MQSTYWALVCKFTTTDDYLKFTGIDIPEVVCHTKQEAKASDIDIQEYTIQRLVANGLEGPLSEPIYSNEIIERLNMATVGQHKNEHWHVLRKGRITSSNFHPVSCKIKYNMSQNVIRPLLSNIMGPWLIMKL